MASVHVIWFSVPVTCICAYVTTLQHILTISSQCAHWLELVRKCCRAVTFAHMHVTGTENQITCTPAIQWLMKVYVNGLLIYNVPHMLSLSVCNWRFSVNRKWLRTAAQLLGCRTWQHSSEMWITCTVAIRLVRELDLICLLVCYVPHAHFTEIYRKRVHIGWKWWENAAEPLHLHICM